MADPWLDRMTGGMVLGEPVPILYVWGVPYMPDPATPRDMKVVKSIFFDWVERVQAMTEALESFDVNRADAARDLWVEADNREHTNLSEYYDIQASKKWVVSDLREQGLTYVQIARYLSTAPVDVIDAHLGHVRRGAPRDYPAILAADQGYSPTASSDR